MESSSIKREWPNHGFFFILGLKRLARVGVEGGAWVNCSWRINVSGARKPVVVVFLDFYGSASVPIVCERFLEQKSVLFRLLSGLARQDL